MGYSLGKYFFSQQWGRYPSEELIRFIAGNFYKVDNRKDIKILEVGCGPGANLWYIAREGFSIYGIDGSKSAIEIAKTRLDGECNGWHGGLFVDDFSKLSFEDEYFNAVIDHEAVYCNSYAQSKKIYNDIRRVLKKNGKLFVRTFAKGSWGDGTGELVGHNAYKTAEGPLAMKGYSRFTCYDEIPDLLDGFKIEQIELINRTVNNGKNNIKEWIVIASKN